MLKSVSQNAGLMVCSTCRFSAGDRDDEKGRRGGEIFAGELAGALARHPCRDRIAIRQMPCLLACANHCSAYLSSDGRMGYVLGRFAPTSENAVALLNYIAHYLDSADGVVSYGLWPEGVKGHFLARVPPEGAVWDPAASLSNVEAGCEGQGE